MYSATPDLPPPGGAIVRRLDAGSVVGDPGERELPAVAGMRDALPPGIELDALVDAVVQRIERKVVEELERRGRWPGGELY